MSLDEQHYIKEKLLSEPPIKCDFKVGDIVTVTNDYGASFKGKIIIGFSREPFYGRFIHLSGMASPYWFPMSPESLRHETRDPLNRLSTGE